MESVWFMKPSKSRLNLKKNEGFLKMKPHRPISLAVQRACCCFWFCWRFQTHLFCRFSILFVDASLKVSILEDAGETAIELSCTSCQPDCLMHSVWRGFAAGTTNIKILVCTKREINILSFTFWPAGSKCFLPILFLPFLIRTFCGTE